MPLGSDALLSLGLMGAQIPASADDRDVPLIVVTARRAEERAQDVPLHVDVISSADIRPGAIENLQSLASHVPGLSFEALWGGWFSFPVLRGQNQPSVAGDAVGMFVDGVYQANRDAADIEPLDLDRIEVVHGPQSALFGHSSFAGLIHYVPARPTEQRYVGTEADIGSDMFAGVRLIASGPLNAGVKARFAASWRSLNGTWTNEVDADQHMGNSRRFAGTATLASRDWLGSYSWRLSGRYGYNRMSLAPFFTLDHRQYNCGGQHPASGAWTYSCGNAPLPKDAGPHSRGLPDSKTTTSQVTFEQVLDLDWVEARTQSSYYHASSNAVRELDGNAAGELYGVCDVNLNCRPPGSLVLPISRLQSVQTVLRRQQNAREFTQELRARSTSSDGFRWELGAVIYWRRSINTQRIGAERGGLAPNERFTALFLDNPFRVGPVAIINNALANDPNTEQAIQNDNTERRRTIALFGVAEKELGERVRLRGEVRASWERLKLNSRRSNFAASFGDSIGAQNFFDLTPRASIDWRPRTDWLVFASYARGSRSGGINPVPNLLASEQTFEPETNWTAELGLNFSSSGMVRRFQATAYHIDWRNTQILGFATTPGVAALVTRNTKGIDTWGIEISARLAPAPWVSIDAVLSHAKPAFKRGSEDPGDRDFCGLTVGNTSTLCDVVSSSVLEGMLVPDISGNRPERSVENSWAVAAILTPRLLRPAQIRLDVAHQGNAFERQINGLFYGKRTLLGARIGFPLGPLFVDFWGTNLTNDKYVRASAPRAPIFYPTQPRPLDLILGEGRRVGMTLRYSN